MFIESPANDRVKTWAKLKTKKGRGQQLQFLAEGVRLFEELLQSGWPVEAVLWDAGTDELPDDLRREIDQRRLPWYELSPEAFAAVSDTVTPQGVLAIAKLPSPGQRPVLPETVVLFDGVADPGNLGTLIRSAFAFGCAEVVVGTGSVDPFSPKVVRASMGSLFRVPVWSGVAADYIALWKEQHTHGQVIVADAGASDEAHRHGLEGPTLMVIGNEAVGVSPEVAALATTKLRIPMVRHAESLNAAMAGTIMLYEAYRQRSR